ncbi:MAG: hypothetical protein OEV00_12725 [Acidobacteriota bacterium]|nr:hypothetical protein [Acidobacteriota bacterium]MDH3786176.1 hypothetical protein [Acidobacteriota bacterium]
MSHGQPLRSLDQVLVDLAALRDRQELGNWLVTTLADRPDVLWASLWDQRRTDDEMSGTGADSTAAWRIWDRAGLAVVTPVIDRTGLPLGAATIIDGDDAGKTNWHNDLADSRLAWARMPGVRGVAFQPITGPGNDAGTCAILVILASVTFVGGGVAWLKTLAAHMTQALGRAAFVGQSSLTDGPVLNEEQMREFERRNLRAALQASDGKIYGDDGAAARLGLRPTTLASRLSKHGLDRRSS